MRVPVSESLEPSAADDFASGRIVGDFIERSPSYEEHVYHELHGVVAGRRVTRPEVLT